jgi:hypothetical protein
MDNLSLFKGKKLEIYSFLIQLMLWQISIISFKEWTRMKVIMGGGSFLEKRMLAT